MVNLRFRFVLRVVFSLLCLMLISLAMILRYSNWIPPKIIPQNEGSFDWIQRAVEEFKQHLELNHFHGNVLNRSNRFTSPNHNLDLTFHNEIVNASEKLFVKVELPPCKLDMMTLKEERFKITHNSTVGDLWNPDLRGIHYGGSFSPSSCKPDQKLAIIIPYRDRPTHLDILMNNLHTVLSKQNLSYTIFVVEIALPKRFNRGLLCNIAFKEANHMSSYDCFAFHDVDLIPLNEKHIYRCTDTPIQLVTASSKFNYRVPYADYVGGAIMFSKTQYETVNGFSNMYFGWGGEDDDLGVRIKAKGLSVSRPHPSVGKYFSLPHEADVSNPKNPERFKILDGARKRIPVDGLNSLKYKVISIEFRPQYTWIYVTYDEQAYQ